MLLIYTITKNTTTMNKTINITVPINVNKITPLYDLEIEFYYEIINGSNISINLNTIIFDKNVNDNIISSVSGSVSDYKTIIVSNLKYTSNINITTVDLMLTFTGVSMGNGSITINRFELKPKISESAGYYNIYSNPDFLYSYNTSVNGLIDNPDKNTVHIYLNEKYKNLLVIVNQNIPMNVDWKSINNIDLFAENYGLYYGKTIGEKFGMFPLEDTTGYNVYVPDKLVASNYIKTLNNINDIITFDTNIHYHYIDELGNYASTQITYFNNSTFNNLPNWVNKFPPFLLKAGVSDDLFLYKKPYTVEIHNGPNKNIKDKYIVYDKGNPIHDIIGDQELGTIINVNNVNKKSGYKNVITRFSGYYEPMTKDIPLFKPLYYWNKDNVIESFNGNYKFNVELDTFGIINETMYSKVNEYINVLKLQSVNEDSIFPILDEVGLSQTSRNIFSSPWDNDYYIRTLNEFILFNNTSSTEIVDETIVVSAFINNILITGLSKSYYSGINIYGKSKSEELYNSPKLTYTITIDDLSNTIQTYKYIVKYQSSQKTYIIASDTTNQGTIILNIDRPIEIKDSLNYEEFTKWNLVFELYSETDILLDFDNSIKFNVYNDIIKFELVNPTPSDKFYVIDAPLIPFYVDSKEVYSFGITVNETIKKLKNIKYKYNLYLEKGQGVDPYSYNPIYNANTDKLRLDYYDLLGNSDNIINLTKNLTVSASLPSNNLNFNSNEVRRLLYTVTHNYIIEDEIKTNLFTKFFEKLYISRTQELPILLWSSFPDTIPPITILNGSCDYITHLYSGDTIVSGINITNTGGMFDGTVRIIFSLRENGITILSKSFTQVLHLGKGETTTEFRTLNLGSLKSDGTPIITYDYNNYEVKFSSSVMNGSSKTENIPGVNKTTPNCN